MSGPSFFFMHCSLPTCAAGKAGKSDAVSFLTCLGDRLWAISLI
jgi:hypothetical protein